MKYSQNEEQQVQTSLSGSGTYTLFTIRLQTSQNKNQEVSTGESVPFSIEDNMKGLTFLSKTAYEKGKE